MEYYNELAWQLTVNGSPFIPNTSMSKPDNKRIKLRIKSFNNDKDNEPKVKKSIVPTSIVFFSSKNVILSL